MARIIFTLILILAAYVGYTYFFGKGEEKTNAQVIVNETRDLGKAVGDFLRKQKDKYDAGDFDALLDKMSKALTKLKSDKTPNEEEVKDNLRHLDEELRQIDPKKLTDDQKKALQKLLNDVDQEIEK